MTLKLGTETGSLTNYLMSGTVGEPTPEVGMGCTILGWTDRHAGTIIKVTKTQVHVQRDKAIRVDNNGMSESQEYMYARNENASIKIFRKTKRGWKSPEGNSLRIGERDEYYDYSF